MFGGEASHLPLKLNTSGVIPPIFASSLLLLPATIANFEANGSSGLAAGSARSPPIWRTAGRSTWCCMSR